MSLHGTVVSMDDLSGTKLIRVGGEFALRLTDERPDRPLYWFLISMGYKTYRFLPVFFCEFYPRHDVPTPLREQEILDALASARYPGEYDPQSGGEMPETA